MKNCRDRQKPKARKAVAPNMDWADWCLKNLVVPNGRLAGQPWRWEDWQLQFFEGATADDVREAAPCVARKNGKSAMIAGYLLAHLVGPKNFQDWRAIVVSLTGNLAAELRNQVRDIARASGLSDKIKIYRSPAPGRIIGLDNAEVTILAADRASGHAVGADLAIFDELGLTEERDRPLMSAVFSSLSGRDGVFMAISIRGASPMMQEMLDRRDQDGVYVQVHEAPADCDLDDEGAWASANPGLGTIKSRQYLVDACRRAKSVPANQNHFRSHDLNQPLNPGNETLCSFSDWKKCIVERLPEREGPAIIGLDLGGSASMSAAAIFWPVSNSLEAYGCFPTIPSLAERGAGDGVGDLYLLMERRGELLTAGERVTPVDVFLGNIAARLAGSEIVALVADRFRQSEVLQLVEKMDLNLNVIFRGQEYRDGGEDVLDAQREIMECRPKVLESLLLEHAISEAKVTRDPSNNAKIDRSRQHGRIDAAAAMVLALGAGRRLRPALEDRKEPRVSFL